MKDDNKKPQDTELEEKTAEEVVETDDVTFETEGDSDMQKDPMDIIKKLKAKIKTIEAERIEYLNGWQRARADYANFKKQTEDDRAQMIAYANKNLAEEVLPVMESFDMAMGNKESWEQVPANWRVGVEYIAQQLRSILENHGVTEINPLNQPFDLTKHEAVAHIPVNKKEDDHKVIAVIKKGYLYKGSVLVPARVNVGEFKE
ncbi:MAG: nucleotide exchange factor GrpE [bacterium]